MKIVVTGSAGHLGEGLLRTLSAQADASANELIGIDIKRSPFTSDVVSITDAPAVRELLAGADLVYHTATLHKPHVATHSRQDFVDTNVTGTLNLLEAAREHRVPRFVFTSTTSTFGAAMRAAPGEPAVWVTEALKPVPRNIYGVTKVAAEDLCELFHRVFGLSVLVLRTSRFFPEEDDSAGTRSAYSDDNTKVNEYLYRRVELEDVVTAHRCAAERAPQIGFGRYIISATSPFEPADVEALGHDPLRAVERRVPGVGADFARLGWRMFERIDRVYDNGLARRELGWSPAYDFRKVLDAALAGERLGSALADEVGSKGYHDRTFSEGPYPVDTDSAPF